LETDGLETFWSDLLSADPARIRSAASGLSPDERQAVVDHLRRMAAEPGWSDGQRRNARAALHALGEG
jgi:hypothetical protein